MAVSSSPSYLLSPISVSFVCIIKDKISSGHKPNSMRGRNERRGESNRTKEREREREVNISGLEEAVKGLECALLPCCFGFSNPLLSERHNGREESRLG